MKLTIGPLEVLALRDWLEGREKEKSMPRIRVYAGTAGDTRYYTDVKDCLPPDIHAYAEFDVVKGLDSIMDLIREREADGLKISWQVGEEFYVTPAGPFGGLQGMEG